MEDRLGEERSGDRDARRVREPRLHPAPGREPSHRSAEAARGQREGAAIGERERDRGLVESSRERRGGGRERGAIVARHRELGGDGLGAAHDGLERAARVGEDRRGLRGEIRRRLEHLRAEIVGRVGERAPAGLDGDRPALELRAREHQPALDLLRLPRGLGSVAPRERAVEQEARAAGLAHRSPRPEDHLAGHRLAGAEERVRARESAAQREVGRARVGGAGVELAPQRARRAGGVGDHRSRQRHQRRLAQQRRRGADRGSGAGRSERGGRGGGVGARPRRSPRPAGDHRRDDRPERRGAGASVTARRSSRRHPRCSGPRRATGASPASRAAASRSRTSPTAPRRWRRGWSAPGSRTSPRRSARSRCGRRRGARRSASGEGRDHHHRHADAELIELGLGPPASIWSGRSSGGQAAGGTTWS